MNRTGGGEAEPPLFTIVTAVHDVEPYLPDFIRSVEDQAFDRLRVEVVAVDDGSTDGSLELLRAWAVRQPALVTVLSQPNAGQGAARNTGLERARGTWVNFADPDDLLEPGFLSTAARFAAANPGVELLAGKPILFMEAGNAIRDKHPRRAQYDAGERVVNLDAEPNVFPGSTSVSFYRLDRIRRTGLRFDPRVRPNFEDGQFTIRYLLGLERPEVALLPDARYVYRKRAAGTSVSQAGLAHPGRYGDVLEHGYLAVLDDARRRHGRVPAWLQHVLIYELSWYLSEDEKLTTGIRLAPEAVPRFHELLARILRQLEPEVVAVHGVRRLRSVWRDVFLHAGRDAGWHSDVAVRTKLDRGMRLQRVSYRFVGPLPAERFVVDGVAVEPPFIKTMSHTYYGRSLIDQRVAWLPAGNLEVWVAGKALRVTRRWRARRARPSLRGIYARWRADPTLARRRVGRRYRRLTRRLAGLGYGLLARSPLYARFARAWVLMDRIADADDNAERLFEHLRARHPEHNAWFVVARDTPDWPRLRGLIGDRLVAHGSFTWKMLMLNASWLISSHADRAIVSPREVVRLAGGRPWRYAFLQHGIMKDDLSLWLNPRDIDLFVVSTDAELQSVVADGTAYVYTAKETRNVGLPRFDRLLEKRGAVPPQVRDLVIVAPTWRTWLTRPAPGAHRRDVDEAFWSSDYLRSWLRLLAAPELTAAAERQGWQVAFMPHPNLQPVLPDIDLPAGVAALTFAGNDVQALYARCALLVTDYSSVAFNVAYIDGPVVYYQFDREAMMSGAHMGRKGYFDYRRHGFGPVVDDEAAAIAAIVASIERGPLPSGEYQARIEATFPNRDGLACARTVAALEELSRPYASG